MTRRSHLVFALIGALALPLGAFGAASPAPSADRDEARALLRDLVDLDTTHEHGTLDAAQLLRARFLAAGFPADSLTLIAPAEHPRSANLIVRVHGRAPGGAVLFMGHLDVVAARREDWSVDPFRLQERDGWYYGRGTADMKSGDAALAAALLQLHRRGWVPDHDVIAAFTADEEAGGDANGPAFLLSAHRELLDATLAFNLDGGGGTVTDGVRRYYEFGTSEKSYLTFTLETTAPGGHGSLPGPDNPIYRLAHALTRIEAYRFEPHTSATTRGYFAAMADQASPAEADALRRLGTLPLDTATADRLSASVYLNALLRTTCVATLISGGHAENALPQRARATVQCRLLPGDSAAAVEAILRDLVSDPTITLSMDAVPIVSPESAPDPALVGRLARVVHSMWPGVTLVPSMATGFSDDRQTRNAGIPSYDVGGLWMPGDENRAHGRDERIPVAAFDESIEYTVRLLREFGANP